MFVKTSQVLTGLTLALSLSAFAGTPAKAEPNNKEILLSQLPGYEYNVPFEIYKQDWVKFKFEDNVVLGRVRGKAGDIISVELLSPETVTINDKEIASVNVGGVPYYIQEGDDVILKYEDGKWVMLSETMADYEVKYGHAMPYWVSRLDLKEAESKEIDFGTSRQVEMTPAQSSPVYRETTPTPVRGLW